MLSIITVIQDGIGGSPCGLDYHDNNRAWKETAKGLRGLQLMYYLISGLDIEQAGRRF